MSARRKSKKSAVRLAPDRHAFKDFVLDQLNGIPALAARAMFGGYGLYAGEKFFGIVWRDTLYLRTSPATVAPYLAAGMGPFRPNRKQTSKRYYEVPADIIDRRSELLRWAAAALTVA
jgi:DNA transformation protein